MLFKVDFEKAFDSISWVFLDSVLSQMGFPALWRKWVMGLLMTARTSILVNGSPTLEFDIQRGVRQGDPLSPLLFILAMEALHIATKSAVDVGIFKGLKTPGEGPTISHLLYADDALFVGEWSDENFHNLARMLRCFHLSSGLKVNFSKSKVFGIGVGHNDVLETASIPGCEKGSLPFSYLGLPVGSNMGLVKNWKPIIERFENKLSLWKARTLSFGGRMTLVKALLGGSSEDEQQKPFWKQTNKEFLAEKRKNGTGVFHPKNAQTCLKCNEAGHIASDCSKDIKAKQGASQKMKDKVVEKSEKSKIFKNSKNEVGECSKKKTKFYKRQGNDNQVWVAKKDEVKVGDESGSTKPEEPQVIEKSSENDDVLPSLKFEEVKKKIGKIEFSNQFYDDEKEFDVEKTFNGNVKKIFGKMLSGKAKGVKDFYATKKATYNPTAEELKVLKSEKTWREVCFPE
ncbi:putative RNA-directed DNA polymerase [Helianthus annuus]|uniref:Putative reverse transcriptase domain, Zinc finger, CCHC-type n=1 Tax=Helianthus annuus TaxID=4232 RepID=A0A251U7I9_HELAN|nr:putative RNA-directed DNA polymerase [Helianthus annuus]